MTVDVSGQGGGDGNSNYPAISSNGQFVAFASEASNLLPGDTNGLSDVFVRDVINRVTRLVSAPIAGATRPVITPDGR